MSTALVPEFASCASSWGNRQTPEKLAKRIDEMWSQQPPKNVLFLGSGNGQWSVMSVSGFGIAQEYNWSNSIAVIKQWIKEKWNAKAGWTLTGWALEGDTHFVVMTQNPSFLYDSCTSCAQEWTFRSIWSEVRDWICDNYDRDYIITDASYSKKTKQWVVVMTKSKKSQSFRCSEEFPKEWVREQWNQGRCITTVLNVADSNQPWMVVATSGIGSNNSWSTGLGAD